METILVGLLKRMLTKKILEKVLISLLKEISKRTDNTIDDELVKAVEGGLK